MNNLVADARQHVNKACSDDRSPVEAFAAMDQHVPAFFQAFSHCWQRSHEVRVAQDIVPTINEPKLDCRRSDFWVHNPEVLPKTAHYHTDVGECGPPKHLCFHLS